MPGKPDDGWYLSPTCHWPLNDFSLGAPKETGNPWHRRENELSIQGSWCKEVKVAAVAQLADAQAGICIALPRRCIKTGEL